MEGSARGPLCCTNLGRLSVDQECFLDDILLVQRMARTPGTAQYEHLSRHSHIPDQVPFLLHQQLSKRNNKSATQAEQRRCTELTCAKFACHLAVRLLLLALARERTRKRLTSTHSPWKPAAAAAAHVRGACACSAGACSGCAQQQPASAAIKQVQTANTQRQAGGQRGQHCICW